MPKENASRENRTDKTSTVERKVQAYMPPRMYEEFINDAEEHDGQSGFIRYLYRRYKREEAAKADQQNKAA